MKILFPKREHKLATKESMEVSLRQYKN